MNELRVINVGQGDSLLLLPDGGCKFGRHNLIVDLGQGAVDVFQFADFHRRSIVLLTHAHRDHIGGLVRLPRHIQSIDELWLPAYFDQVVSITEFILNLKGIDTLATDDPTLLRAKSVRSSAVFLSTLAHATGMSVVPCSDGLSFCDHVHILNPPKNVDEVFNSKSSEVDAFADELRGADGRRMIERWLPSGTASYEAMIFVLEGTAGFTPRVILEGGPSLSDNLRFIHNFLLFARESLDRFAEQPTSARYRAVFEKVKLTSNSCSVVLDFRSNDLEALLTGDAEKTVFNRLIRNKSIGRRAVLKLPHHGSLKNVNQRILNAISPDIAVVCHNNGRFGRQKDPHPSLQVIEMLAKMGIDAIYTNPVIKNGQTLRKRLPENPIPRNIKLLN